MEEKKFNPETLRTIRMLMNLRILEVADAIGVSRMSIMNWESGRITPKEIHQKLLAKLYRVNVEDFYDEFDVDFRDIATKSVKELFLRNIELENPKYQVIALDIYKHLYPEPTKVEMDLNITEAEEQDQSLLEPGDVPKPYEEDEEE